MLMSIPGNQRIVNSESLFIIFTMLMSYESWITPQHPLNLSLPQELQRRAWAQVTLPEPLLLQLLPVLAISGPDFYLL